VLLRTILPRRLPALLRSAARRAEMYPYTVAIVPTRSRTRVLLTCGPDELLRAALPPSRKLPHEQSLVEFLSGLSLWLDERLRVVLCVDAKDGGFCLGLTDERGTGTRSLYFDVEVAPRRALAQGTHLGGVGNFRSLHQLVLWPSCLGRPR
jgi:hypothetical protein